MKTFALFSFITFALYNSATALTLPLDTLTTRDTTPAYYNIGENELGPIYSSVAPQEKRDEPTWYAIGSNEHGTIYSSVEPQSVKREEIEDPSLDGYQDWLAENGLNITPRGLSEVEKRLTPYQALVNCMALCGQKLATATGDSITYRIQYCLAQCALQFSISSYNRGKYMDQYPDSFPPANTLAGGGK